MLFINKATINTIQFPDKTYKIECSKHANVITWLYDNDEELFQLYCIAKHLGEGVVLNMPYVPNARFDRVKTEEEVFTLKHFAEIINSLHFKQVNVLDVHSNVASALIENINVLSIDNYVEKVLEIIGKDIVFFFPDEGAVKRYDYLAQKYNIPYCYGIKNRDWKTGKIKNLSIITNGIELNNKQILIVDDICSRGGTFYFSAKALKEFNVGNIYLYVSHLENTVHEGELINSNLIKTIFATNSIYRKHNDEEKIMILD